MRWLLTGEEYDAAEAHRIGFVQEVVEPGRQIERAIELAEMIAEKSSPLGVPTSRWLRCRQTQPRSLRRAGMPARA